MRDSHYPVSGDPIVFFDLETTGLCSRTDAIIEIAAVKYIPGAQAHPHMARLIRIDKPVPRFITNLTGITDEMLGVSGHRMEQVLDEFIEFIADHDVVAFNLNFDTRFLNAAIARHGRRPLRNHGHCALARAREAWPEMETHKLAHLATRLALDNVAAHRALNDTLLALEVYFCALHASTVSTPPTLKSKALATGTPSAIPAISGPRQFRIEVLGTGHHQAHFERVCGPRTEHGAVLDIQVQLRVETGSKGVRVLLEEEVIGNLSPRMAQDFRRALIDGDLAEFSHFECAAKIRGGRVSTPPNDGNYVMWLDIPQHDD